VKLITLLHLEQRLRMRGSAHIVLYATFNDAVVTEAGGQFKLHLYRI
jgi:hypothetical protein